MTVTVAGLSVATREADELVIAALDEVAQQRGGTQLLREILADAHATARSDVATSLARVGRLIGAFDGPDLIGIAGLTDGPTPCIAGVYVAPAHRRRGVGLALVSYADTEHGAKDAWALPGDRATKSLYEKVGWRARRLTMSGD
jgi:GNAT superfamily N-acetyltransferase